MSYTQLLYHIVFATKNRMPVIEPQWQRQLYVLLYRQILRHRGKVFRINGMPDHVHMLVSLAPIFSLSEVMKIVKQETSKQIADVIPGWWGWQDGYGAFSCSFREKDRIINYIVNQQVHHGRENFNDEYRRLLEENGVPYDKYLE